MVYFLEKYSEWAAFGIGAAAREKAPHEGGAGETSVM
jgi:hypothetical protein